MVIKESTSKLFRSLRNCAFVLVHWQSDGQEKRRRLPRVILVVVLALVPTLAAADIPAFPGAQGGGALAVGGRGGTVCKVTNLKDSGSGSLRSCVERSGRRIVIFEVGGTIFLDNAITISNPYITIAGQTAPGGGIQLAPGPNMKRNLITVRTHDVVIRYLRLRQASHVSDAPGVLYVDNLGATDVHSVIFDHLSLYWSPGTATGAWGHKDRIGAPPKDMTWQYVIVAESLPNNAPVASNVGAQDEAVTIRMTDIDFHNNLFAHNGWRNALLRNASGRWINNVVYDWTYWATRAGTGSHRDFISNIWKPGPSRKSSDRGDFELGFKRWDANASSPERDISTRPNSFYVVGNRGDLTGMSPDNDNWIFTREIGTNWNSTAIATPAPLEWKRNNPLEPTGVPITARHVDDLENYLLPIVGASRRLDCEGKWVPARDAADVRIVEQYRTNKGYAPVVDENDVGGLPKIAGGLPCDDTSGDGIPDRWLVKNGLDPSTSVGGAIHESGYSYLELFLSGMSLAASAQPPLAPARITVE